MLMATAVPVANSKPDVDRLKSILPGVPLVESPFFDDILPTCDFDAETARVGRDLHEKGFAVVRFPDEEFDARAERIKNRLAPRFDFAGWRENGWKVNDGLRVQDAWTFDADVRAIAVNARILQILEKLYGRKAWPFQTLNFPVGTQQHYHSDSVHFSSIPERFMCGVWVALEDIGDDAGPLEYYPGSHKWPIVYNDQVGVRIAGAKRRASQELYHQVWEALVEKTHLAPEYFSPRKGDALIWAANLLHGGSCQRNPNATRWSQVTHYFFENCCYVTPMASDMFVGKLQLRRLVNIADGKQVPNVYVDAPYASLGISFRFREFLATMRRSLSPIARKIRH